MPRYTVLSGFLAAVLLLSLTPCDGTAAGTPAPQATKIRVMSSDDMPITGGEVEFYKSGDFVMRLTIDADGYVELDHGKLEAGTIYTISILDADYNEIYVTNSWRYDPAKFDPEKDAELPYNKYIVDPILQGLVGKNLRMDANKELNPKWEEAKREREKGKIKEEVTVGLFGPPKVLVAVSFPFTFGNFGANEDALAGIPESSPLFGLTFSYRHGFPQEADVSKRLNYREVSVCYSGNRYVTDQVLKPGEQSDVTFHRFSLSYGMGTLKGRHDASAALAVAYGGIYDGGNVLEYLDRTYSLFGFGLHVRYILKLVDSGSVDFGLMGQGEFMYYPADSQENDHWYGLAPTLAVGVVMRVR